MSIKKLKEPREVATPRALNGAAPSTNDDSEPTHKAPEKQSGIWIEHPRKERV